MSNDFVKNYLSTVLEIIYQDAQCQNWFIWYSQVHNTTMQLKALISSFPGSPVWIPPGSSIHGILQARILEWAAMPSSRGSFWPSDWTCVSCLLCWQTGSVPLAPPGKALWLPYTIAISPQVVHIRETKMYVHTKACTQMAITVFLILSPIWEQPKWPPAHEWINNQAINQSVYWKMQPHGGT